MTKKQKYVIALTAAIGLFPVALDLTIVNVAIIPISKALKADINTIQWISIAYILANAAMVTLAGYLGSRFGVKRFFSLGLAIFGLCSLLCALAPDVNWLIAFRALQGISGGILLPIGMAIALEPFSKEERSKAAALVFSPVLLAPVIGPIVGGLIIDNLNWQSIFYVNVPLALLGLIMAWRFLPRDKFEEEAQKSGFDYLGLLLSTGGIVAVVYAFKLVSQTDPDSKTTLNPQGSIYGWGYGLVWVLLGLGSLLLIAFAIKALRFSKDPVLDLRLFKSYEFVVSNLINWVSSTVSFGLLFLIPDFLQAVRLPNMSAVDTGLALVPMGLATVVGMILGSRLYPLIGARPLVLAGGALFTIGFWQLSNLTPTTSGSDLWFWLLLLGAGISVTSFTVQILALEKLNGEALNKGSSLVQSTKLIFGAVGSAVLVTLLYQQTTFHAGQLQAQYAQKLSSGTAVDPGNPQVQALKQQLLAQATTSGMNDLFAILAFTSVSLMVIALALPRRKPLDKTAEVEERDHIIAA